MGVQRCPAELQGHRKFNRNMLYDSVREQTSRFTLQKKPKQQSRLFLLWRCFDIVSSCSHGSKPELSLILLQSNRGRVHGYHYRGSEGSNQRAGEADPARRPIQVSYLHGEYHTHMNVCLYIRS